MIIDHLRTMMLLPRTSAASRLSSVTVILMSVSGALLFTACDDLLPKNGKRWMPPEAKETLTPEGQFREARLDLMGGKAAEAAARLRKLDAKTDIPQPLHNWITLYAGLAELEAGREAEARPLFAKLVQRGPFTQDGGAASQRLADFFVDVGRRMSATGTVSERVSSNYDRMSHEAIALYLYALKNENVGDFEEALALHRHFTTSDIREKEPWPGFETHFRHSRKTSMDLVEYEDFIDSTKRALHGANRPNTPEEAKKAASEAQEIRSRIKRDGKLLTSLDAKLKKFSGEVAERVEMYAESADADAKALPEAKKKWEKLGSEFQFVEAKQAILEPRLTTEKALAEQESLAARMSYLENFKFYLIQELRATGYSQPVTLRDGTTFSGGITSLDDNTVNLKDGDKVKPVPWAEVAPESILSMAKSLVTTEEPEDAQGFRKWHLGSFAGFIGKTAEARMLLTEAAKLNPSYEPDLPLALEWLEGGDK